MAEKKAKQVLNRSVVHRGKVYDRLAKEDELPEDLRSIARSAKYLSDPADLEAPSRASYEELEDKLKAALKAEAGAQARVEELRAQFDAQAAEMKSLRAELAAAKKSGGGKKTDEGDAK